MGDEFRALTLDDDMALRNFRCCGVTGRFGAQDIERQVRHGKAVRRAEFEGHRFVGWLDGDVLIGCAYHEPVPDSTTRYGIETRYIRFIALDDAYQGEVDHERHRFSDRLLHYVYDDIRAVAPQTGAILLRIAPENDRSLAFVDRHGYVQVPEENVKDPLFAAPLD